VSRGGVNTTSVTESRPGGAGPGTPHAGHGTAGRSPRTPTHSLGLVGTPLVFWWVDYQTGLYLIAGLFLLFLLAAPGTTFPQVSTGYQFSMAFKLLG